MIYLAVFSLLLFGSVFLLLLAVRSLRWMGIVQQKEYRLDRLQSFLRSEDGQEELKRIVPQLSEFSRTGLKRPKITPRILILALTYGLLLSGMLLFAVINWLLEPLVLAFWLLGIYLAIPALVFVATLPTVLVARIQIYRTLKKARRMVVKYRPRIIGIGGSYGKTSTKLILAELLSQQFSVFYTPKSFNNAYSVAQSIVSGYRGEEIAVIEYGAYRRGEIEALARWLPPEMAVITGLTEQHLSLFGSMDSSVLAESELVSALSTGSHIFYNSADAGAEHIVTIGSQGKKLTKHAYGKQKLVSKPKLDDHGRLSFIFDGSRVQTNLVGLHYLENIEGAAEVAGQLGVSRDKIIAGLENFQPGDNFVRSYRHESKFWILDDSGTSNPEGFKAIVDLAAAFKEKQKVLVFPGIVDLGEKSAEIHSELATRSDKVFDTVMYVGQDGGDQFSAELGEKLISGKNEILSSLDSLEAGQLLVLEGRMPSWLEEKL